MKSFTRFPILLGLGMLSGCSLLMGKPTMSQSVVVVNEQSMAIDEMVAEVEPEPELQDMQPIKPDYVPLNHFVKLENYVEQMAIELSDLLHQGHSTPTELVVASFVRLDGTLQNSDQLGNQLAETFIHQLHRFGYQVVDSKLQSSVQLSASGDFAFSRSGNSRFNASLAEHVLSGTMVYREKGVQVNARVMSLESKKIVATTSRIIPWYVLRSENILISSR